MPDPCATLSPYTTRSVATSTKAMSISAHTTKAGITQPSASHMSITPDTVLNFHADSLLMDMSIANATVAVSTLRRRGSARPGAIAAQRRAPTR